MTPKQYLETMPAAHCITRDVTGQKAWSYTPIKVCGVWCSTAPQRQKDWTTVCAPLEWQAEQDKETR
jgi:hypothetical protein